MTVEYWECGMRKCKWIGTDDEKGEKEDGEGCWTTKVCPKCGAEGFYLLEGKKLQNHLKTIGRPVIPTPEEIDSVWGNANFGTMKKIDVLKMGVLKCASGYIQGHTSTQIITELELVTKSYNLTARGRECLWSWFSGGSNF